jgi:uncharacterized protein (TIGR03663 family)
LKRLFVLGIAIAAVAALALRLPQLDLRPMHGDEAIHAVKFNQMQSGEYRYDPNEYHGPSLYQATWPLMAMRGLDFQSAGAGDYRLVPALFGVALLPLLLLWGDGWGRLESLAAAMFAAISPAMVFYSRYYIQETPFVFFSFALLIALWRYARAAAGNQRRAALWWAIAVGACVGILHATKETWVLSVAAMLVAALAATLWTRWRDGVQRDGKQRDSAQNDGARRDASSAGSSLDWRVLWQPKLLGAATLSAIVVAVLLLSNFGRDARGPLNSLLAFGTYFQRGAGESQQAQPPLYYLKLLLFTKNAPGPWWSEALIVGLAAVGFVAALNRRTERASPRGDGPHPDPVLLRWVAFYTVALVIIYSVLPYKTPWSLLSFLHAMTLLAGVGVVALLRALPDAGRVVTMLLLMMGLAHLTEQSRTLNFKEPFPYDRRNPYVHSQPAPDAVRLAERVRAMSRFHAAGRAMTVQVVAPGGDYWPLPWYLRDFKNAGYNSAAPADLRAPVIIAAAELEPVLSAKLGARYHTEYFGLRPSVLMALFIDERLWKDFVQAQQNVPAIKAAKAVGAS